MPAETMTEFETVALAPPIPLAYIRPVREDDVTYYAIHDEEGQPLGLSPTRALAIAAIRKHDMEPADAH